MKVIVCGAGRVGMMIARQLASENNSVTVIDQSAELIRRISETQDVRAIHGFASHPEILEQAGAADADMLIAVTQIDEINMVACEVAGALFDVPTKIARVRSQAYLDPVWGTLFSRDNLAIDVAISPEKEVAEAIRHQIEAPGAADVIPLADGKVQAVAVRCQEDCPLLDTPLRQLTEIFPQLDIIIVGIIRDEKMIVPDDNEMLKVGDEVYFVVESGKVRRAMAAFGHEENPASRTIIVGGGNVGQFLAKSLQESHPDMSLKVIEQNFDTAQMVKESLSQATVIHGDALDPEILEEANVATCDMLVAVTNEDEVNILATLLAKRHGAREALALVNTPTYNSLVSNLGVDAVVDPNAITVSTILRHVRQGRIKAVHSLREGFGEIIEAEALETSGLVGPPLREAKLPKGVIVGAIVRGEEVIMPRGGTVIHSKDLVILYAASNAVKKVEKMFAVRLEYF
ncbi:MAG: Trk system potassium transporter TrkA [Alphaproteobacteria bacterium]